MFSSNKDLGISAYLALKYSPRDLAWPSFLVLEETPSSNMSWM